MSTLIDLPRKPVGQAETDARLSSYLEFMAIEPDLHRAG